LFALGIEFKNNTNCSHYNNAASYRINAESTNEKPVNTASGVRYDKSFTISGLSDIPIRKSGGLTVPIALKQLPAFKPNARRSVKRIHLRIADNRIIKYLTPFSDERLIIAIG
jgi:hypothetical protein